ncbi:MBL fold metallo-hydrolase [Streptomyces sp. YS-B37]|uniref:MBL fold metallo-hydrolase n=1 Tax=Streptomyces sp. YS-B37 TaxID=3407669 RepID=UPI003B51316F
MSTIATLTGTGVPYPDAGRAGAGVLVRHGRTCLQFDAGRATVLRLAEAKVGPAALSAVFLTHHHSDHSWPAPCSPRGFWRTAWPERTTGSPADRPWSSR